MIRFMIRHLPLVAEGFVVVLVVVVVVLTFVVVVFAQSC